MAGPLVIEAAELERSLAPLLEIGAGPRGHNRLAWTAEDAAAAEWFAARAAEAGLAVERDPAGSLWAVPDAPWPWWAAGSHLDTVRDGGRYDGALGVAAAFEVAARATRPLAVIAFADEEGARFNTPTFGSRALVGRLDAADVLARRDDEGVTLREAMTSAGVDPDGLSRTPERLDRLSGFLELHVDQTTDVAATGVPAGIVGSLAARLRVQAELRGRADHAGTTRRTERRDAFAAAARLAVRADELAGDDPDFVVTAARVLVEPNAPTTIPSRVRLWIDARAADAGAVDAWRAELDGAVREIAERTGVEIGLVTASRSAGVSFDPAVRQRLRAAAGATVPELVCFAGHDAGVVAERRPAGMVLVRNPTGVSHSPDEAVSLEDAAFAANVILRAVEELP